MRGRKIFKCEKCNHRSPSRALLQNHIDSKHENRYFCQGCFASFATKYGLANHKVFNSDSSTDLACCKFSTQAADVKDLICLIEETDTYSCKACNYTSDSVDQANKHVLEHHHKPTKYFCNGCILELTSLNDVYLHLFDCQSTDLSSEEKQNLYKVIRKVGAVKAFDSPTRKAERPELNCPECNYKTKVPLNLDRHHKTIHLNVRDFICEECLSAFTCKQTLIKHKRYNSDSFGVLQCHRFTAKSFKLSELIFLNEANVNFSCLLCNHAEQTEDGMKGHIAQNHPLNLNFVCHRCKEYFPDKSTLAAHIKTSHVTKLNAKIKFCQDISDHVIKNMDTKEFMCMSCDFVSANVPESRAHIFDAHIPLAQHTCDKCKQEFGSNKISFLRHLRICFAKDSTAEYVACHVCPFNTKTSGNLLAHFKRRHQIAIE